MTYTDLLNGLWCAPYDLDTDLDACLRPLHPGPCKGPRRNTPKTRIRRKAARVVVQPKPSKAPAKPSNRVKGRDVTDEIDFDDLKHTLPPGKIFSGDPDRRALKIGALQGFDGLPDRGTAADLDALIAQGGREIFRGTKSSRGSHGSQYAEDFRTGPMYYGPGIYSSGIYSTTDRGEASAYADHEEGAVNRMVLHPEARVIDIEDLRRAVEANNSRVYKRKLEEQQDEDILSMLGLLPPPSERERDEELEAYRDRQYQADATELMTDTSYYALAKGYDAVRIPSVGAQRNDNYVLLNRTAVLVEDPAASRTASAAPHTGCTVDLCLHPLHPGPCKGPRTGRVKPRLRTRTTPKNTPQAGKPATPVKGTDLTDDLDYAALSGKTRRDATGADEVLTAIAARQRFDGQPQLASAEELDRLADSGAAQIWRGVEGFGDRTGADLAEQFRTGTAHYGQGVYGNGIYASTDSKIARAYAGDSADNGGLLRMVIHPDANIISLDDAKAGAARHGTPEARARRNEAAQALFDTVSPDSPDDVKEAAYSAYHQVLRDLGTKEAVLTDPASWAMANGYDGYYQPVPYLGPNAREYIMFNRTALITEDPQRSRTASAQFHSDCTVEMCRSPLHPGPCKGWKRGTGVTPKIKAPAEPKAAPKPKAKTPKPKAETPEPKPSAPTTKPSLPSASGKAVGRNISKELDYTALHSQRSTVFGEDERLTSIAKQQGFGGKPELVSAEEFDKLVADSNAQILYRGLQRTEGASGADLADQFRDGDAYYGSGIYGNGIYSSPYENTAKHYAENDDAVIRMVLRPDAKTITLDEARRRSGLHRNAARTYGDEQRKLLAGLRAAQAAGDRDQVLATWKKRIEKFENDPKNHRNLVLSSPTAWAMANGYDAVTLKREAIGGGGDEEQVIILNRTAVIAEDPKRSRTASAHTVELCRNPLHPGPCKGWKRGTGVVPKITAPKAPKAPPKPKAPAKAKGRNLTGQLDYGALRAHDQLYGRDRRMSAIAKLQGFDGKPELVSTEDFDKLAASGTPVLYRGVHRANNYTGPQLAQQFRDGDAYFGRGSYGNGIYASPYESTAKVFARGNKNAIVRMALRPGAKTITLDEAIKRSQSHRDGASAYYTGQRQLFNDMRAAQKDSDRNQAWTDWQGLSEAYEADPAHSRNLVLADPALWAMANGYDAVTLNGPARNNGKPEDQVIILNRTAVVAEDPKLGVTKPPPRRAPASTTAAAEPGVEACRNPLHKGPCRKKKTQYKCTGKGKDRRCVAVKPPPKPLVKVQPQAVPKGSPRPTPRRVSVQPRYTGPGIGDGPRVVLPKGKGKNLIRAAADDLFRVESCLRPLHPGPCAGPRTRRIPKIFRRGATPTPADAPKAKAPRTGPPRQRATGTDLTGALDYMSLRDKALTDNPQDDALADIARQQGFDARPALGTEEDLQQLIADGGTELWRGVKGSGTVSGAEFADEFRDGDAFFGRGAYGNGIYTAYSEGVAGLYSGGEPDSTFRMVLHPRARVADGADLDRQMRAEAAAATAEQKRLTDRLRELPTGTQAAEAARAQALTDYTQWKRAQTARDAVLSDKGRYAAALGYDAIRQPTFGSAGDREVVVLLNRGAVTMAAPSRTAASVPDTASRRSRATTASSPSVSSPMGAIVADCPLHSPHVNACLHPVVHPGPCKGWKGTKAVKSVRPRHRSKAAAPAKSGTSTPKPAATPSRAKKSGPGSGKPGLYQSLPYEQLAKLPTDNNRSDDQLYAIAQQQGFHLVPALGDATALDDAVKAGGTRLWRGMQDALGKTGAQFADEFRTGKAFYGQNPRGNGIITKNTQADALNTASSPAAVVEMVLPADARVITRDDLAGLGDARAKQWSRRQKYLLHGVQTATDPAARQKALDLYQRWQDGATGRDSVLADPGRLAAALGYDAIADRNSNGSLTNVTVLNRGALLVNDPSLTAPVAPTARTTPTTPPARQPQAPTAPTTPTAPAAVPAPPPLPATPNRKFGKDVTGKLNYNKINGLSMNTGSGYDARLAEVAKGNGFDGKPTVVTKEEADELVKAGGIELWRGVSGFTDWSNRSNRVPASELTRQFRENPSAHYGQGIYSNGIYSSTERSTAAQVYSDGTAGSLLRLVLPADAKVISYQDASRNAYQQAKKTQDEINAAYAKIARARTPAGRDKALQKYNDLRARQSAKDSVLGDASRWAAANGYDATTVPQGGGEVFYVLLNRTALAVEEG